MLNEMLAVHTPFAGAALIGAVLQLVIAEWIRGRKRRKSSRKGARKR